ncbi:hypothetical protein QQF64_024049 [Cirrhinus molitorella]|uniref:Galectin n=1 Tax=Cirrhinus molitorella TaxID=172907 RepID=A0ABR3NK58_9TELE
MVLNQQPPILNPSIPFYSTIQGGLLEGMTITVCGQVLPNADRFHVDLQYGSDIALHFNPRYQEGSEHVVHNTLQNNIWGDEENVPKTPFPRSNLFALQILITLSSYKISTNGEPFSEFKHRMNFSDVDSICIGGMVEVSSVAFQYPLPKIAATHRSWRRRRSPEWSEHQDYGRYYERSRLPDEFITFDRPKRKCDKRLRNKWKAISCICTESLVTDN